MPPPARSFAVTFAGLANVLFGGAYIALGVVILVQGAEVLQELTQAGVQVQQEVQGLPAEAQQGGDVFAKGMEGMGGFFAAFAAVIAGCTMLWGLPQFIAGLGVIFRKGWGRVLAILFGFLGILAGLGGMLSYQQGQVMVVYGLVTLVYGIVTLAFLLPGKYAAEFRRI
jgi:hypothetical protein